MMDRFEEMANIVVCLVPLNFVEQQNKPDLLNQIKKHRQDKTLEWFSAMETVTHHFEEIWKEALEQAAFQLERDGWKMTIYDMAQAIRALRPREK